MDNRKVQLPKDYEYNLSDFTLFLSVMKNKEAYQCVLSIIMNQMDLELEEVKVEQVILNEKGLRAIRLDAWARDQENRQFNIEMQNDTSSDDMRKRARFGQSLMDSPILKSGKGTKYKELPATIIIFITQDDIFGRDLAMYTFLERCEEVEDLYLDDGTKKIFCNMKSKNGREELVSLLQYMKRTTLRNPDVTVKDRRIIRLDEIVSEVKQSGEWEEARVSIYKIGLENGREEGLEEGRAEGKLQMLFHLVKKGRISQSEAAEEAGLTEEMFLKRMEEAGRSYSKG